MAAFSNLNSKLWLHALKRGEEGGLAWRTRRAVKAPPHEFLTRVLEQQHLDPNPERLHHAVCGKGDGEGGPVRCPPAPPRLCTPPSPRTALQRVRAQRTRAAKGE